MSDGSRDDTSGDSDLAGNPSSSRLSPHGDPLRVAQVTMDGRIGGPQLYMLRLASRLDQYNIEPIIICPSQNSGSFREAMDQHGVTYRTLPLHRLTRDVGHLAQCIARYPLEICNLAELYRDECLDLVHCRGNWQFKGMLAGRLAGISTVWGLNNIQAMAPLKWMFNLLAPSLSDGFIPVSHRTRRYYLGDAIYSDHVVRIIQAPVDTERFDPGKLTPASDIANRDGLQIVSVGAVNFDKGFDTLIRASAHLEQTTDLDFEIHIVGPMYDSKSEFVDYLRTMRRDLGVKNLFFKGYRDDIPDILKAADLYVCSSDHEASPTSVWEAMSMAKPIVATDVGDVARHLRDGEHERGLVVPPQTPKALARAIEKLARDPERRARLGARARTFAVEHLDLGVCVRKHAAAYRAVIQRCRSSAF